MKYTVSFKEHGTLGFPAAHERRQVTPITFRDPLKVNPLQEHVAMHAVSMSRECEVVVLCLSM